MFDLEQSIAEWRRQMLAAGIKSPVPLEELESHLRDEIEQQMRSGLNEQRAFGIAMENIGRASELKREFKKTGTPMKMQKIIKLAGIICVAVAISNWERSFVNFTFLRMPRMRKALFTIFLAGLLASYIFAAGAEPVSDRITVAVMGKGPDVVLIPGAACSSAVWDATAKRLERRYRLHIVQVAGFAGSPPRASAQGPVTQPTVNAIDAYIKANKLKAPMVIGHSLGGLMGLMLAVQHPEDVSRLMIVDELPFFAVLTGATNVAEAAPRAVAWRDSILAETQDAYARNETNVIRTLVQSPEGCKMATAWAVATDKSVLARVTYEVMTTDMRPKLPEIKMPVTILYPWDASKGISQAACDKLYRENYAALPNKKFVRIDDSYHFIMLDQPDAFAAQVHAFLK